MARNLALFLIRLYQRTLSPDHGPMRVFYPHGCCPFYPTCSMYGYGSIERHGVMRGSALAVWRVLRCNPLTKGGSDPVPE